MSTRMIYLALRNTRRRPGRTLLTSLAIGIAVASITFLDAYMSGIVESMFDGFIRLEAGHVKIMPHDAVNRARPIPLDKGIQDLDPLVKLVSETPGVTSTAPRIRFGVLLNKPGGTIPAMGIAMVPSAEKELMNLGEWIVEGSLPNDSSDGILLGDKLAKDLQLGVGDELFMVASDIYGGFGPGVYTVAGLTRSGINTVDRKTFYVPLYSAQQQLAMENSALEIVCRVDDGMEMSIAVADTLQKLISDYGRDDLSVVPWQKQGHFYEVVQPANFATMIMMILLGIVALATVINTVLMSVMERTRELGTLRALGFGQGTILRLIMVESLSIGVVSTIGGLILGMAVSLYFGHHGIDFSAAFDSIEFPMKPIIYTTPNIFTAVQAGIFGLIVSVLAAWYPARVAVRLQPAVAIRAE